MANAKKQETVVQYRVKAPLVVVPNPENGGAHAYLYQGVPVPAFVSEEDLERFEAEGLIEAVEVPAPAEDTPVE